ncbi:MAG: hypothetical protein JWL97_4549 [Gemmatimonadales bacterium]|nr:hypothetical protein [Gemmatimonadales bacterium]
MSDLTAAILASQHGRDGGRALPAVTFTRYACPWCDATGVWGQDGERCANCSGVGFTDDPAAGVDLTGRTDCEEVEPTPLPRPPAVMKAQCVDCAFRPGSPEDGTSVQEQAEQPFFCHHGMHRVGDGYQAAAWQGSQPLGYFVCAGWWAFVTRQPLSETPFRDPGGADRTEQGE